MTKEALERFDANVSHAVPKLRKHRRRERDLGERGQPFVDEALKRAQRGPLVTRRISVRQEFAQLERIGE
jgi:hypothetical protein